MAQSRDGLQAACRSCDAARKKARYQERKESGPFASGAKLCSACEQELPLSEFNRNPANQDGYNGTCRPCRSTWFKSDWYPKNRDVHLDKARTRRSTDPGLRERERLRMARARAVNPEFYREKARRWREANRERAREIRRAHYQRHRAQRRSDARSYQRLWRQANRELAAIKDANKRLRRRRNMALVLVVPFTAQQLSHRMSMWPGCWMCGGPKDSIDHVKPIAKGGAHCLANLRPACQPCNASKQAKWPYVPPQRSN